MAWIEIKHVSAVLRTDLTGDLYIVQLIDHCQGLAEAEIGAQATPPKALQSVLAEIVARFWRAGNAAHDNPSGVTLDQAGPFSVQQPNAESSGLGLTNREIKALKKAVGKTGLWVQPLYRSDHLETGPYPDEVADPTDPIDTLAGAQADMPRPRVRR